jgi:hypothetical protein
VEKLKKAKVEREPTEEIDLLDTMLTTLLEILEEKGVITEEEYEKRLKRKSKSSSLESKRSKLRQRSNLLTTIAIT